MAKFFSELFEFIYIVISYWQAFATAGVVAFLTYLYERFTGQAFSSRIFIWGIVAFLLVSFFMAWRDERHALLEARSALDAIKKPLLSGRIEQVVTGDSPELQASQMFILMTVRNVGAPSIAEAWRLTIKSETLNLSDSPTFIPEGFTLHDPNGKSIAVFHKSDAIYEKTVTPIERGGLVRGWIRFILNGVTSEHLRKPGTTVTVSFKDVLDTTYEASQEMTGGPSQAPLYFPGADQPFGFPPSDKSPEAPVNKS